MKMRSCWVFLTGCLFVGVAEGTQTYYYYYKGEYCGKNDDGRDEAYARYTTDLNNYNNELYPAWKKQSDDYNSYLVQKEGYDKRYAEYLKNKAEWEASVGSSGLGVVLDLNSHVDGHPELHILTNLQEAVEVPQFSDINTYRQYCQQYGTNQTKGGWLKCENRSSDSSGSQSISFTHEGESHEEWWSTEQSIYGRNGTKFYTKSLGAVKQTRTVNAQYISGGYAGAVYPFSDRVDGISDTCEKGSVVLIGTLKYPIEIEGPVFVDGDVVIRGFVKGQGSIYAGRNIHIIGDITYYDPPSWPHSQEELAKAENTCSNVTARNLKKDLLLLAARGNIIVGDYTSTEWTNATQMAYLDLTKSGRTLKTHTTSETDIGYTSGYPKSKSYAEEDGGQTVIGLTVTEGEDTYGHVPGMILSRYYYIKTFDYSLKLRARRYYESSLGEVAIQNLKQTSATVGSQPSWRDSTSLWKRFHILFGSYQETQTVTDNTDSGDVTEIDAILYANHGIFGVAGGTLSKRLHMNGAMICRDEGLLTSFAERFKDDPTARAWINWDMRIKSDLKSGLHIGAPERTSETSKGVTVKNVSWNFK